MSDDAVTKPAIPEIAAEERRRVKASHQAIELGLVLGLMELAECDSGKISREEVVRRIIRRALDDGVSIERTRTVEIRAELERLKARTNSR